MKSAEATYLRAGVEIRLDAGWKTYWRDPGDSGVPPTFDFSGSDNVKSVTVQWPAPERFPDGAGGNSIGYVGRVILPLRMVAKGRDKTFVAAFEAQLRHLRESVRAGRSDARAYAVRRRRRRDGAGKGGAARATPRRARRRQRPRGDVGPSRAGRRARPRHRRGRSAQGAPLDLFVEGPTPDWSLPLPEPKRRPTASAALHLHLDGLPPGASAKDVTLDASPRCPAMTPSRFRSISTKLLAPR